MATVNKDFKIKHGLVVEGSTGTINGNDILTKAPADQEYIQDLVGGSGDSNATANTLVLRDSNGSFSANVITADIVGDVTGNADTATALATARTISIAGDATGSVSFDGSANAEISITLDSSFATDSEVETARANAVAVAGSYTDGEIADEVTARDAAILLAKNDAIADAASDATTKANAAYSNATSYTDTEVANAVSYLEGYADTAATNAENNAKAYADGLSSGLNWKQAVNVLATSNISLSGSTPLSIDNHTVTDGYRVLLKGQSTDSENGIYVMSITGGSYTLTRPEDADAYGELVGAAVFVMEGDNYASTAWVQSDHYLSSFAGQDWTQFSGQGTYLAGNGLILDGTTFEIDSNVTATLTYVDNAAGNALADANDYTDTRETAITSAYQTYANGVALTAEQNANFYTDGKITDEISDRNTAITNAINALSTSDIEEGSNQYFTDARAKDSAADLLTGATLTNITITGTGSGLTITAENGVADSTTSDLAEGSNLYFTDARVANAISSATEIAPQAIDINTYRREEAAQQYVATASTVTAHTFTGNWSVKYLVRVIGSVSGTTHSQVTELLVTVDQNNNVAVTEYGSIHTSENALATFTADYSGSEYRLRATTAVNGCEVIAAATMLSWAD